MNPGQKVSGQKVSSHNFSKRDTVCHKGSSQKVSGYKVSHHEYSRIWFMEKYFLANTKKSF